MPLDNTEFKRQALLWLSPILDGPELIGARFPSLLHTTIYIGDTAYWVTNGAWSIASSTLHLPSQSELITKLDRLSILSALASRWGISELPEIREKIMFRLGEVLKETALNVYVNTICATILPSRIAIHPATYQVAAQLNERWSLPSGAPAEVNASWITLDF